MLKDTYSIKELESLSGVKAQTIRVWEQRYDLLKPERTDTNIRRYNRENLRKLMQISYLSDCGWKISKIVCLNSENLDVICANELNKTNNLFPQLSELLFCIAEKDIVRFDFLLDKYVENMVPADLVLNVLEPLMSRIRQMWIVKHVEPIFEEYILNKVFIKLIQVAGQETKLNSTKTILIFKSDIIYLPTKLSLVYFLAAVKKYNVQFFFNHISVEQLCEMKGTFDPDIVYTEFNDKHTDATLKKYIVAKSLQGLEA